MTWWHLAMVIAVSRTSSQELCDHIVLPGVLGCHPFDKYSENMYAYFIIKTEVKIKPKKWLSLLIFP